MLMKYVLGMLLFGAGLISGIWVQRVIAPSSEATLDTAPVTNPIEHASLKDSRTPNGTTAERDGTLWTIPEDIAQEGEPIADEGQPSATFSFQANHDGVRERGPGRESDGNRPWTNREAWAAHWRAEQLTRQANMRSNLVKQAGLSDDQTVRFDVLMSALNLRLQQQAQILQSAMEAGTMSRPELRARAMKEIGTALALTYDELDRSMPADWRTSTSNEAINLWTFIDPEVMRALRPAMSGRARPPNRDGAGRGR